MSTPSHHISLCKPILIHLSIFLYFCVAFSIENSWQKFCRYICSKCLWRWYINTNITFLDIIHRLVTVYF
jgi:hypothetical protein